jgi:serine/threonine protein kinase/tetratricopeptide (TPR) repeat protein
MSREQWEQVCELYHNALSLPASERAAFLMAQNIDPALQAEVMSLLEHTDDKTFAPAIQGARDAIQAAIAGEDGRSDGDVSRPVAGENQRVIGRYRLLTRIGEGGMGEVWLAEQTAPIRRHVAFKLIRAGVSSPEVMARFESERQTLALMDHPAIAKVFDAGATPEGILYFAMEYVDGAPITAYADNRRLTTRDRLQLFVRVCEGVQHAHQKAIIHRDLKPSNILVTEVDGKPAPKIIDFGVAKAVAQEATQVNALTRAGAFVGTPEYMSPEQAAASPEGIDTRTDVYALGIILYELLVGVRPIELRDLTLEDFLRNLREREPEKPSTRIRTRDDAFLTIARNRQEAPAGLAKQMSRDLDWITLKALEKDRARRYGSPSELAADIERYLRSEPVYAAPPSTVYRMSKFARRFRVPLSVAGAFVLVLIAAAAVSIAQSIRANREAATAQAVADFLRQDVLAQASTDTQAGPGVKPDPDLKVRTALERAGKRIQGKFDRQPEVEADIRTTIGETYLDLGLYPEAETHLRRALALYRGALGENYQKTLRAMSRAGYAAFVLGKYPEAQSLESKALEGQRRTLGPDKPDTLVSLANLAVIFYSQGKYAEAESLDRQILEIRRRVLGPEHPDTLATVNNLAIVYYLEGKYAQAEPLYVQTLNIRRKTLGRENSKTVGTMNNLGQVYVALGEYAKAEALDLQALEIRTRLLGPDHRDTQVSLNNLANVYYYQGKFAEAESLYLQSWESMRHVEGPEHPDTLTAMGNLGAVYVDEGEYAKAEEVDAQAVEIRQRVSGPRHPATLLAMNNLSIVYAAERKYAQAEALFRQTLDGRREALGAKHPDVFVTLSDLAFLYQREGKYDLAENNAAQALAGRRESGGATAVTAALEADVALARESQGKFAEAEGLARESLDYSLSKAPDDWQRFRSASVLGASLAGQKRYPEAERLLLEGYRGMLARQQKIGAPDRYHLQHAREDMVRLYEAWGQPEKAKAWIQK